MGGWVIMGIVIPFEFEYKKCNAQQKTRKKRETVIELVRIFVYACF